jgi:hypothetical protein
VRIASPRLRSCAKAFACTAAGRSYRGAPDR